VAEEQVLSSVMSGQFILQDGKFPERRVP